MASVPFGGYAAQKVRHNMTLSSNASNFDNKKKTHSYSNDMSVEISPSKYCAKMMNSIWGLYNRYSVHNLKSSTSGAVAPTVQQLAINGSNDWMHTQ